MRDGDHHERLRQRARYRQPWPRSSKGDGYRHGLRGSSVIDDQGDDGDYSDLAGAALVMVTVSVNEKTGGATDRSDPLGRLRLLDKNAEVRSRDFANAQFCVDVDISASPHPLHDVGNSFHGAYLVELPGHRVLSNQAGFPKLGEGR
jgi:hypothetical protein